MSTLDREPRLSGGPSSPLSDRRIDPGTNAANPSRINQPPKLAPAPPKPGNSVR